MGGGEDREKAHRPDLDLAERDSEPAADIARLPAIDDETGARQAQLWKQIGAGPPESPEAAATLAIDRKGAGRPADANIAARVAGQTGVDVSGARVHDDPLSRSATSAMQARAFAHGQDVFLGPGESATDPALLGHELAHVAQSEGAAQTIRRKVAIGAAESPAESHADQVGAAVASNAAPEHMLVDGGPLAPGQMYKAQFVVGLREAVVRVVEQELGKVGATAGCPYIDKYFGRYSSEPAQVGENLLRHWLPNAKHAHSAQDLVPLVLVRVRDAVRAWHSTGRLPPDLAAIDPNIAADAAAAPPVHKKSIEGMEAELGPGQALDHTTAAKMSRIVGADVSGARIHTGTTAAAMAAQHGAAAFAVGQNVVMGSHAPRSGIEAEVLLAHELAHTAQQSDAAKDPVARRQPIGPEAEAAERDARLARLGNFAGAVGDVMRTGLQLQRCQMGEVDAGPTTEQYYHQHVAQIAAGAAEQLRTLPFATYDDTVAWTGNGMQQFAGAMADQITPSADLDSLLRPELIGKLVAEGRVVTQTTSPQAGRVEGGANVSKGPDAYFPSVGTEVGNALARRTAESLQREIPRYAQARIAAGGKEPGVDDVTSSHPIDPLVLKALTNGNVVTLDTAKFKERHPSLAGPPHVLRQSRQITLTPVGGLSGWYRLESPLDATPEEVALALTGSPTESFRLEVAHPLYGLEEDTRGTFAEEANPVSRATQLASSNDMVGDEAALSQAGAITTKSSRPRARILEQMRKNANVLRMAIMEVAVPFDLSAKIDTAAGFIEGRATRLATADDTEVAKWDSHVEKQAERIARGGRGLASDVLRLDAYKSAGKGKGDTEGLPHDHPLREDARMWADALLACDLVESADKMLLAAANHSMTLEIEILERGLATPQSAAFSAADAPDSKKDFDTDAMATREIEQRRKLGQLRAQMLADPSKVDPKVAGATNEDTRNLIFESQVAAQAVQLEHEWRALDQAVDSWTTLPSDQRDAAGLKTRAKKYYGQWQTIYGLIKKGEAGDKAAMVQAREKFETLAADKEFQGFVNEVKKELEEIHQHQMIVMIIAMVAITVVSMGAGSALSAALGGTTLVVEGTEIVVGGIGVARNTAAVAGFIAEAATFTALSNMAFSKDHSVGALLGEFGKNLIMFGAMRAIGAGIKAVGLTQLVKAGEDAGKLAKIAAKGGDMLGQTVLNSGIGVMTAWVEQKVKEAFGAKPMTEQEAHDAVVMAVAQAVIFTIGGRLIESPIKKIEVDAAFAGKRWQLAVDGWAVGRKANLVMQAKLEGGKGRVAPEEVIEAAHRDQLQIEREISALEDLAELAKTKEGKKQGLTEKKIKDQMEALQEHGQTSLGVEMALTMKDRGNNFFEADAAEVARVRALHEKFGSHVTEEGKPDPDTSARTWLITPKGEGATSFHIAEMLPDWAITPSGKMIIAVGRRAKISDAKLFSLAVEEREAMLALQRAADQGSHHEIDHALGQLKNLLAKEQQALVDAMRGELTDQAAAKKSALDPAAAKEQAELARIRQGTAGKIRGEAELSNADVVQSMNAQLGNMKSGEVDAIIDKVADGLPDQRERVRAVLARSSGFGRMESLNELRLALEPHLKAGGKLYTPGRGSLADNMLYLDAEKHSFDKAMPHTHPPIPIKVIEPGTIVILDDVVLAKISDPVSGKQFASTLVANKAVLVQPRGFTSGNTMYSARTPEAIATQTRALLDRANAIQTAEPTINFDIAVTRALDERAMQALEGAGDPAITSALKGQLEIVDPAAVRPGETLDTSSAAIAGKLNSNAGMTESHLEAILAKVPEADRPYLRELLAQQAEVYSPRRQSNELAQQSNNILALADQQGIPKSKVYYFIPKPNKSYGMVTMAHRQATGTAVHQYIEGPTELAARVASGELGPSTMVVIFDDVAGSGDSLVTATNITTNNGYRGKVAVSPIVTTGVAERVFNGDPGAGTPGVTQGNPNVTYMPGHVAQALKDTPFFQGLSAAQQQHLYKLLGHEPRRENALGYDENGLSMAFPYMAPDNNNQFFGAEIAEEYVVNKNDHDDAVKTYRPWTPKVSGTR
jgi:hypothetical protein